jgi:hypothetical protein
MEKVVEELHQADKEGQLSDFVTWRESNKLPYLQACIKEALRKFWHWNIFPATKWRLIAGIHPVVGLIIERCVPKGGIVLGGHYLPEGTIVGMNPWVTA